VIILTVFLEEYSWRLAAMVETLLALVPSCAVFAAALFYLCWWLQYRDVKVFAAAKLEASGPEEPLTLPSATEKRLKRSQMNIGEVDNTSAGYRYNYSDYVRDAAGCGTQRVEYVSENDILQ
jgi:hypothetical protein